MKTIKRIFSFVLKVLKWGFMLLVILTIISALYNLTLPTESEVTENLTQDQKVFISETVNLLQNFSNEVWPGWEESQIPIIVYNEKYAFIIGYDKPPAGWIKMPQEEHRGSEWEVVKTDDFFGTPYYRQLLTSPDLTPENFTAIVGETWVVTMQTKEYAAIAFYKGFRNELPPVLKAIFPYCARLLYRQAFGDIPYYYLPDFGGSILGRGYYTSRFIDRTGIYGQAEYRFPIWKIISGTAFYDLGQVQENVKDFNINSFHHNFGFGPRFSFGSNENSILGMDFRFSNEGMMVFFHAGHAF